MAKVLVLYYSAYGHIEAMAYAVAEGAKSAGAEVTVKRVPELVPEDVAKACISSSTRRPRSPRWRNLPTMTRSSSEPRHALRHGRLADAQFLGSDRRPLGAGQARRQGRLGLHLGHAARRPGIDHPRLHPDAAASWPRRRRPALRFPGPDGRGSRQGRLALRSRRSPTATARASLRKSNWTPPASRAPMSPRSRQNSRPDVLLKHRR